MSLLKFVEFDNYSKILSNLLDALSNKFLRTFDENQWQQFVVFAFLANRRLVLQKQLGVFEVRVSDVNDAFKLRY